MRKNLLSWAGLGRFFGGGCNVLSVGSRVGSWSSAATS